MKHEFMFISLNVIFLPFSYLICLIILFPVHSYKKFWKKKFTYFFLQAFRNVFLYFLFFFIVTW